MAQAGRSPSFVRPLSVQVLGLVRPQSGRKADGCGRNVPSPERKVGGELEGGVVGKGGGGGRKGDGSFC